MKTFTALVKVCVGQTHKVLPVEVRAYTSSEAKWLLQAVYGFHSVLSAPTKVTNIQSTTEDAFTPPTPDQQRINQLKATKDRASDALNTERDRQKRNKAMSTLSNINKAKMLGT